MSSVTRVPLSERKNLGLSGIEAQAIPQPCVALQSASRGRMHRDVSRFTELGVPNRQHAVDEIHVVTIETQWLVGPQTRGNI